MANITSSKKRARQAVKRQQKNLSRRSSLKTAVKKVLSALNSKESIDQAKKLLREAEAKISRAKGKRVLHKKTAQRKISRLASRVAKAEKASKA